MKLYTICDQVQEREGKERKGNERKGKEMRRLLVSAVIFINAYAQLHQSITHDVNFIQCNG